MMTDSACTPPLSPEALPLTQAKDGGTIAQAPGRVKREKMRKRWLFSASVDRVNSGGLIEKPGPKQTTGSMAFTPLIGMKLRVLKWVCLRY